MIRYCEPKTLWSTKITQSIFPSWSKVVINLESDGTIAQSDFQVIFSDLKIGVSYH
ncbi:unnamed protein product [Hymenolepis diminuta]|uniref:Uncharacterized protein n=1 Tax=Hymenolepis diminuta TaxID=6216 RepID=A0A564Z1M0_HYMDI|nr:unnamed protein product [Hymenolepis diminuta]